jgi:hypothetical protein
VIHTFRPLAVAVGVGATAGLVIAGGGSRLAMRAIALEDRDDFGLRTSAGAVVGDVTFGGTLDLLLLSTALGVVGGLLYLVLRGWLPPEKRLRAFVFAWLLAGFGLFFTVNGNQDDFTFVNVGLSLGLFGLVLALFGVAVSLAVDPLAPRERVRRRGASLVTAVVVALALAAAIVAVDRAVDLANGTRTPS